MMYSKRFRNKVKEMGSKHVPNWMVYACWCANIRRFPAMRIFPFSDTDKFIGD